MGTVNLGDKRIFDKLNDRQRIFCVEYAVDLNGKRAATEAGYKTPSMISRKLLRNPNIQKAIATLVEPALKEAKLDRENVHEQLRRFGFYNIAEYMDAEGNLRVPPAELPYDLQQCIVGFETRHRYHPESGDLLETTIKVKLVDKLQAIFKAMDYLQMLAPQEHNVNVINWEEFYNRSKKENKDTVEAQLVALESKPVGGE